MKKVVLLFTVLTTLLFADDIKLKELLEKVKTTPVEMKFDLEIFWSVREKTETKKGHLFLNGEDNSFNVTLGKTQWVSDAITVWQYNTRSEQLLIQDFLDINISMNPANLFEQFGSKNFKLASKKGKVSNYIWKRADEEDDYREITIEIDTKKELVKSIVMTDTDYNKSSYRFKSMKFKETFDETLFEFKKTEDMYIIDNR